jgi:hypothetical protein
LVQPFSGSAIKAWMSQLPPGPKSPVSALVGGPPSVPAVGVVAVACGLAGLLWHAAAAASETPRVSAKPKRGKGVADRGKVGILTLLTLQLANPDTLFQKAKRFGDFK